MERLPEPEGLHAATPELKPGFRASIAQANSVAGSVAALGGGMRLPWQTITAGEAADVKALVAAAPPIARHALPGSLRQPALALLVITALDVAAALLSDEPAALKLVAIRAVVGAAAATLSLVAGHREGPWRLVAGICSAVAGLVQTGSMLYTAGSGLANPSSLLRLVPSVVSQASALVMLLRMVSMSLRERGR